MSYSRLSDDCDVYIFLSNYKSKEHGGDRLACCGCALEDRCTYFRYGTDMLEHLQKHIDAGHKVPDYVIESIQHDIDRWGNDALVWGARFKETLKE